MAISVNTYFSGAGLMDLGLLQAGIEIVESFEIDESACKTYRHNIGNHISQIDIAEKLVFNEKYSDGMVFTYPCNKYSDVSQIHGMRTGDELFLHALRHMAIGQPEFYVVENVPGMRKFPVVMEAMTELPNYYIEVFCPVNTNLWLPQTRERLIIIGTKRPFAVRPPSGHKRVTLKDILESNPDVTVPESVAKRLNGTFRDRPIIRDPNKGEIAPCCLAHYSRDRSTNLVVDKRFKYGVRPYSVREFARLQGLPDTFEFPVSNSEAYRQIGNGVSVPVGEWIGGEMTRYMNTTVRIAA